MTPEREATEQQLLSGKKAVVIGQDSCFKDSVIDQFEKEGAVVLNKGEQINAPADILVNLTGDILETSELLSRVKHGELICDGGSIINLVYNPDAISGFCSIDASQNIIAASGGISELGKLYARELGRQRRVRVNTLLVGPVDTPEFWSLLEDTIDHETVLATRTSPAIPEPHDISVAVVFFASHKSSFITGTVFPLGDLRVREP